MLAEGHHAGIEARVVRIENGDVEGRGNSFREHKIKHGVRTMDGKEIATSTCFLEIEEDHEFAIIVYLTPPILDKCPGDWNLKTWVDGRLNSANNDASGEKLEREFFIFQMPIKVGKKSMMGVLKFGKLATTDKEDEVKLNVMESDVGVIRVQLEAGEAGGQVRPYTEIQEADVGVADEAISKKIGSVVRPTHATPTPKRSKHYIWTSRPDGKYTHEFMFKYRTKAILEVLGVLSAPLPPATKLEDPEIKPDHVTEVKHEVQEGMSGAQDVQQELLAEVRAMRRHMTEMRKNMNRIQAGGSSKPEVIDLTGDEFD